VSRAARIVATALSIALGACANGGAPKGTGGSGGNAAAGGAPATSDAVGAAGGAATAMGGATATAGAAGTTAAGGASGASAGAASGSSPPDASAADAPPVHDAAAETGGGACAPPAFLCDDFEKYAAGATSLAPDWTAYPYSGSVRVDATKPRAGKQSLHLTTLAGAHHYADLIRATPGQPLLPRKHYGRLMVWLTAVPPSSHWNLNMSSGPMVGAPTEVAKLAEGGMFGKLMSNYAQRARVTANGQVLLRGVGPEAGDPGADADCAVAAPAERVTAGQWVGWEWEFDGTADEAHLWIDGQAMTEVDAVKNGKQCQGPGFMGRPMMATYKWESPEVWDELLVGWEQYQDTPAQELWIDDVVMSTERVGCPSP
jgi:hypothetical protein